MFVIFQKTLLVTNNKMRQVFFLQIPQVHRDIKELDHQIQQIFYILPSSSLQMQYILKLNQNIFVHFTYLPISWGISLFFPESHFCDKQTKCEKHPPVISIRSKLQNDCECTIAKRINSEFIFLVFTRFFATFLENLSNFNLLLLKILNSFSKNEVTNKFIWLEVSKSIIYVEVDYDA